MEMWHPTELSVCVCVSVFLCFCVSLCVCVCLVFWGEEVPFKVDRTQSALVFFCVFFLWVIERVIFHSQSRLLPIGWPETSTQGDIASGRVFFWASLGTESDQVAGVP